MSASTTATLPQSELPTRIGTRYQVIDQLGRGGMAVVYRVRDPNRDGEIALKQLLVHGDARDREAGALFESEFHTLSQLKHPSVIEAYDYGVEERGPYYTMELLDGGDLTACAPLAFRDACALMTQICSSLSLLHSRRLLHRDISPRNVRRTQAGGAKLIDFGAMAAMGPCAQAVGTPAFIAPEVVHHLSLDARTDLFSLGATLYFALTGRLAFAPRAFSELRDAWRQEPAAPSQIVPDIPPALDDLVLSLLRIDPARRPRSAFEVMQRLAAIAGLAQAEAGDLSAAYLATPTLLGRDAELERWRQQLRRSIAGSGSAWLVEGSAGAGRSRMLDACVFEAKILGATVLRADGSSATAKSFAAAHGLAQQLLDAMPEVALSAARDTGAYDALFGATQPDTAPRLLSLEQWPSERYAVQTALARWFQGVCRTQALVIAVDDVEGIDEASIAWLAALAHAANATRVAILATVLSPEPRGPLALSVLRNHSTALTLTSLDASQTEALFMSVFGNVPHVGLVSDRIARIAQGNPRESLALAQHLVDKRLIRYVDGSWMLPAELALSDLPASLEEAQQRQLAALPSLALQLAQTQALAFEGPWSRADYAQLAGPAETGRVEDALATLVHLGVLTHSGTSYTLRSRGTRANLAAQLSDAERQQRHAALAELAACSGHSGFVELHHLLEAQLTERALDRLSRLVTDLPAGGYLFEHHQVDARVIASDLERAYPLAVAAQRPARQIREILRQLIGLSVQADNGVYYRHATTWFELLAQDSGLADYRALGDEVAPSDRLKTALEGSIARYSATPENQRGYRLDEAIKYLAQHVTTSIVIGARASDTRLLASLPGILEPFAGLSPLLHALWQNVIAGGEMNYKAQPERARARVLDVEERLQHISGAELPNVHMIRGAVAYALAAIEVSLGYPTAQRWIDTLDNDPHQRVNGVHLRRVLCIYDGDTEGAERFRKQAEVLAVQASSRQMFDVQFLLELAAQVHAGDLAGIGQVTDRIAKVAADAPGWRAQQHSAQGHFQRARGDLPAAKQAFEQALALSDPDRVDPPPSLNAWVSAAAGYTMVLMELDQTEAARDFALLAYEQVRAHEIGGWSAHLVRALALAEAKLGDCESAAKRLDQLLEQRAGLAASRLLADYDARARVAIWAKDTETATRFAELAANQYRAGGPAAVRHGRLQLEARHAGLDLDIPLTAFESSVLGSKRPAQDNDNVLASVTAKFQALSSRQERVLEAIELLCAQSQATSGQLYLVEDGRLVRAASVGDAANASLDDFAHTYWQQQLQGSDQTVMEVESSPNAAALGTSLWMNHAGAEYRFAVLKARTELELAYIGVVAMAAHQDLGMAENYWELSTAIGTRLVALGDAQAVSPS
jgi:hypothetical protein